MATARELCSSGWAWFTSSPQNAIVVIFNILWLATYIICWYNNAMHNQKFNMQDWRDLYPYMMGKYIIDSVVNSRFGEHTYGGVNRNVQSRFTTNSRNGQE